MEPIDIWRTAKVVMGGPMWKYRIVIIGATALVAGFLSAAWAGDAMTGAELSALLKGGKTIQLGGPDVGYAGELVHNANGSGSGKAKSDGGDSMTLTGTWAIKGDQFCRSWKEFDDGKEVCETWQKDGANKVLVMVGGRQIGVNHW